jgi:hypothetical protein
MLLVRDPMHRNSSNYRSFKTEDSGDAAIKKANKSLSIVLNEFNTWLNTDKANPVAIQESETARKCRIKKRSLEEKLKAWRSGIGSTSRRKSTGSVDEPPSLVDYSEPDDSDSDDDGRGLEVQQSICSGYSTAEPSRASSPLDLYDSDLESRDTLSKDPTHNFRVQLAKKHNSLSSFADSSIDSLREFATQSSIERASPVIMRGRRASTGTSQPWLRDFPNVNPDAFPQHPPPPSQDASPQNPARQRGSLEPPKEQPSLMSPGPREMSRRSSLSAPTKELTSSPTESVARMTITRRASSGSICSNSSIVSGEHAHGASLGRIDGLASSVVSGTSGTVIPNSDASRASFVSSKTGISSVGSRASGLLLGCDGSRSSMMSTMTGDVSRASMGSARTGLYSSDASKASVVSGKTQSTDSTTSVGSPNSVLSLLNSPGFVASTKANISNPAGSPRHSLEKNPLLVSPRPDDSAGGDACRSPRSRRRRYRSERRGSRKSLEGTEHSGKSGSSSRPRERRWSLGSSAKEQAGIPASPSPSVSRWNGHHHRGSTQTRRRISLGSRTEVGGMDLAPITKALRRKSQGCLREPENNGSEHNYITPSVAGMSSPKSRRRSSRAGTNLGSRGHGESGPNAPRSRNKSFMSSLLSPISPRPRTKKATDTEDHPRKGRRGSINGDAVLSPDQERPKRHTRRRGSTGGTSGEPAVRADATERGLTREERKERLTSRRPTLRDILGNKHHGFPMPGLASIGSISEDKKLVAGAEEIPSLEPPLSELTDTSRDDARKSNNSSRTRSQGSETQGSTRRSLRSEKSLGDFLAAETS